MSNIKYNPLSPYYGTPQTNWYLDHWKPKNIKKHISDELMTIPVEFELRPDLMAYKLYENSNLWWVFSIINPNTLKDPIWDFKTGQTIYVPTKQRIQNIMGY